MRFTDITGYDAVFSLSDSFWVQKPNVIQA